jgi:RTX calcium-binding nonapeptide repeat (4 copies)
MLRRLLALALPALTATALLGPAAAGAATISASGTTITYQAAPGEANFVTVNWGNVGAGPDFIPTLDDHADVTAVAPCTYDVVGARCPSAGTNPTFVVHLGDGNDHGASINDHAAGHHVELFGEDGDDTLQSDASSDLLDGGAGNDLLTPDDDDAGPGDVVVGGAGEDTLQTGNPTGTNGPIAVSFDGQANDGYPGEADNYAVDLEDLSATGSSPSIAFVGNAARNVVQLRSESADTVSGLGGDDLIDGANGNDVLDGGDGNDTIYGGGNDDTIVGGPGLDSLSGEGSGSGLYVTVAGNDRSDARDGIAEQLNCGPGADTAIVDALDVVPQDPGSLCEVVDRPAAGTTPPLPTTPAAPGRAAIRSTALRVRSGRIAVALACPAGGAACTGRLTLRTAAKVKVGKRRRTVTIATMAYTIPAGRSTTVKPKVAKDGRSLLRRTPHVRVRLTATPKTGKATTRTVTLRR